MIKHIQTLTLYFGIAFLAIFSSCINQDKIVADKNPQIEFALSELKSVLEEMGQDKNIPNISLRIDANNPELQKEGFSITRKGSSKIEVTGKDAAGTMYGGLELAEQIRLFGMEGVKETTQNPYLELRGTKFNIPLDARSPTYALNDDAKQKNIAEMWNFDFWKEYIDNLARYRYNYISLWNLHPFPSMVRVPGYEDVALDDVVLPAVEWKGIFTSRETVAGVGEALQNPQTVKQISLEEKIDFWKKVMAYGKSRNIDFYMITWNIFVLGTDGKYGLTDDIDNETTRDYFRKSVKQMILTYPDLAGIGLTTGENMPGSTDEEKEDWAFETYGLGILDAMAEMPDREIKFIHRQHQTGAREIADRFQPLFDNKNIEFIFSFKYAKAHVMSATTQPFHERFVEEIEKEGLKTIWTLRNDDNYYFRWGAPDFVREFIKNIPYEVTRGYYYGSDGWVSGREFTMKDEWAASPREIEVVKHWYHYMMWGRLGYDPDLDNERFMQILQDRYPEVDAEKLFDAWQEASMVYPTTTAFHWGPLDYQWYIEACKSIPSYAQNETGFHDVNRFINLPPHVKSGFQSIPDFVKDGKSQALKTPFEVSEKLHGHADKAFEIIREFNPGENGELTLTIHDIKTMAWLGKYYAFKIAGSTQLALYRETKNRTYREAAVEELENALEAWENYVECALQQNINPIQMSRVRYVDWKQITDWVHDDIKIARQE